MWLTLDMKGDTMELKNDWVDYETFGAVGDGVSDDLSAICDAHAYANEHGMCVRTKPDAIYHLGARALTAVIATDTDWSTSRFTVDDTEAEDHKAHLFEVRSLLEPEALVIDRLTRDQRQLALRPERDCFVLVEDDGKRRYIRKGLNQNNGTPQHDCFVLRRDGSVEADIDWDYDAITRLEARPIDDSTLTIRGGVFTTHANCMDNSGGYDYWGRNIVISRSNTELDGLTHYVVGETAVGCPYSGFVSAEKCAFITLRNCWATAHRIYQTIGAAGKPVSMGSYDYGAGNVVGFRMISCRMNHITDRTLWGVIGSNFCKDILLEDCEISRMDTHMGVSGTYVIRRCALGWMGLNAIGRGRLTVEDSTLYGNSLVNFRSDYGSTWEGDVEIRNCRWIPAAGDTCTPHMINVSNDGTHDFGYPCSMPEKVTVDGLFVDDTNSPDGYQGMCYFTDPDGLDAGADGGVGSHDRPFPYARCRQLRVCGLETASGRLPRLSPAGTLDAVTTVIET
jgi:hypothetical protein